jgi:hypothetical protein
VIKPYQVLEGLLQLFRFFESMIYKILYGYERASTDLSIFLIDDLESPQETASYTSDSSPCTNKDEISCPSASIAGK